MANHRNIALNGILVLTLATPDGPVPMFIFGGPYHTSLKHQSVFGINLKAESPDEKCDFYLPIEDYSVPSDPDAVKQAIKEAIDAAMNSQIIWVGCMGGMGRTGLFLAILAKAMGMPNPIVYVRQNYYHHAVETTDQKLFVENYDVRWVRDYIDTQYGTKAPKVAIIEPAPVPAPKQGFFAGLVTRFREIFA